MAQSSIIVVDLGKTSSKATLIGRDGAHLDRAEYGNRVQSTNAYRALDVTGIGDWLTGVLSDFASRGAVSAIVPVGHGAAAAILRGDTLVVAPLDYEDLLPDSRSESYRLQRDPYAATGSPALPGGLNLGAQLDALEAADADLLVRGATILPWAQYWGWWLSGVASSEVTSLGCHSDLWLPIAQRPSLLAERRGWVRALAPLRHASEALGGISPIIATLTGLTTRTKVHTGLHDSNAALLAARASLPDVDELTVLSTGTWFVAMRVPGVGGAPDMASLAEARDVLVNVDPDGRAIPSARAMLGREIEVLRGEDTPSIDDPSVQTEMAAAIPGIVSVGSMVLPSHMPGVGPFPKAEGGWVNRPNTPAARAAAIALYAALVADEMLSLVGAREDILVEGRFGGSEVLVSALAALRPNTRLWVAAGEGDIALAASRLIDPSLPPPPPPRRVRAPTINLTIYRDAWIQRATL